MVPREVTMIHPDVGGIGFTWPMTAGVAAPAGRGWAAIPRPGNLGIVPPLLCP